MDLNSCLPILFEEINRNYFDGFLDPPVLVWNTRLRTSAGRFCPGSRKFFKTFPPRIEIASYLMDESRARELIYDTLAHEMIHYWLWVRHRPYGHTSEFLFKMKQMGVSRYNTVPKRRPYKYIYQCINCFKQFPTRKIIKALACANCCDQYSEGKYDSRFKLDLLQKVDSPVSSKA